MIPTLKNHCGFVAIVGEPNVGKSTLTNQLVGSKVSIVSRKVQTTRQRVLGILVEDQTQIILVDTPGIFEPKKALDQAMVRSAWSSADEADHLLLLCDVGKRSQEATLKLLERLEKSSLPKSLVLNKIDLISKENLLELVKLFSEKGTFQRVFMVSAKTGEGLADLKHFLRETLPEGPWLYPEDQLSDLPLRMLAAEITREKIFHLLHQELPYAIAVETEKWEDFENGDIKISQIIHVSRENQKSIVLGKGGQQIKKIGELARKELSELLEAKVHLMLFVRYTENWQEKVGFWSHLYGFDT